MENKEEQFSLLSSLISKRDIFAILTEYLTVKEIVGLDNVFCAKEFRDDFLYSLQSITILLPQSPALIKGCVEWCCRRHIFKSKGMLRLYGWDWAALLQGDLSNEYRTFLSRVNDLMLVGDLDHRLHRCPPFSALETLSLESCQLDNSVMQYFLPSTRLQCLHIIASMKFQVEGLSIPIFSEFFGRRIKRVTAELGSGFLRWVTKTTQTTGLVDVVLYNRDCYRPVRIKSRTFFQLSPNIQYLTVRGVNVDSSFFNAIQNLPSLHTLCLDCCTFYMEEGHPVPAVQVKCKRLEILYPCSYDTEEDEFRVQVLDFFTKELQHLSFTACNDICLTLEAFESIPAILSNLVSFEINDRESQLWSEESMREVDSIFSSVRNFRIKRVESGQVLFERWPDRNI